MAKAPLVYLIDPQDDDRESVSRQIEDVKLECRPFGGVDEFFNVYEPHRVACVLAELQLGNATVFQFVKLLRHRLSSVPVILLTAHATVRLAVQAFKSDVFEVLEKPVESFQLWECLTRAFENHSRAMERTRYREGIRQRLYELSRQEMEVMRMVLNGSPNKHIAASLGLSPRTIVFRRKSLMQKMKAKSIGELACMIQLIGNEHSLPLTADATELLDAHLNNNLCEISGATRSHNGDL